MTEAIKKTFVVRSPNIVALVASIISGVGVPLVYLIVKSIPISGQDIAYIVAMAVLTWLVSTCGFDKCKQLLIQIGILK